VEQDRKKAIALIMRELNFLSENLLLLFIVLFIIVLLVLYCYCLLLLNSVQQCQVFLR